MRPRVLCVLLVAAACPPLAADAQEPTWRIGGRALAVSADAVSGQVGESGLVLGLESGPGLELEGTMVVHPRVSAALTVGGSAHELRAIGGDTGCCGIDGGTAWLVPITATVRYHPPVFGAWDPYFGIGAGWLGAFASISDDLEATGVDELDLEAGAGLVAQAGVNYAVGPDWYLNLDIRYLAATVEARFRSGGELVPPVELELDPWLFGFGIGWQF